MREIDIYCDESCVEALFDKSSHKYVIIGGISIPKDERERIKKLLKVIKEKYGLRGEMKWNKISPSSVQMYEELIDLVFNEKSIRYRAICIDSSSVDNNYFNEGSGELGFYKFYYQMLYHWLEEEQTYNIFVDHKINRNPHRVNILGQCLKAKSRAEIKNCQAISSKESLLIQLADVLTGAVAAAFNKETKSNAKVAIKERIECAIGHQIFHTPLKEQKFNIFNIKLSGGGC